MGGRARPVHMTMCWQVACVWMLGFSWSKFLGANSYKDQRTLIPSQVQLEGLLGAPRISSDPSRKTL